MTAEDDQALEALLRWAGRRPMPPPETATAVYQHARQAWLAQVRRRKLVLRGWAWAAGLGAILMAAWGGAHLYPRQVMATIAPGQAAWIRHTFWHPFAGTRAGELFEGDAVQTGAEGATLERGDGTELRMSRNTHVSFDSASTIRLGRGGLYVQTHDVQSNRNLVVSTDLGNVEHLGTQFLVERGNEAMVTAVRDGRVLVHYLNRPAVELQNGEAASVDPHGQLKRWDLSIFDSVWDWSDALATPLPIEGQSLYAVLTSIAQRSGLVLRFSTPAAEAEARGLALHGAPLALQPRDAMPAVLATTTLTGTTVNREILISAR